MCHILSENRVTYSVSAPRCVSTDCKMCVRDTKCLLDTCIVCENFYIFVMLLDNSAAWIGSLVSGQIRGYYDRKVVGSILGVDALFSFRHNITSQLSLHLSEVILCQIRLF